MPGSVLVRAAVSAGLALSLIAPSQGVGSILPMTGGAANGITGKVVDESGAPLSGITVTITTTSSAADVVTSTATDASGFFAVSDLPPGGMVVRVAGDAEHLGEWWLDSYRFEDARSIPTVAGVLHELGEIQLISDGVVLGRVTSPSGAGIAGVWAWARPVEAPAGAAAGVGISDAEGRFEIVGVPEGDYDIEFQSVDTTAPDPYVSEWFDGELWRIRADPVSVGRASLVSGVDAQLAPADSLASVRLGGADRYATSAMIASRFPAGAPVVYVATGRSFPDALSAAAAAARLRGPLLLVEPNAIPDAIAAELRRLSPNRIVLVGGTGAVSAAVERSLGSFAGPGGVRRDAGSDRYSTSRVVAERAFRGLEPGTVFVATGSDFPDALAGSAAAAARGAPVLLVPGSEPTIDLPTRRTLGTLGVTGADIVGASGAVDIGIEYDLRALFGPDRVSRLAGEDRFSTSAAVSRDVFAPTAINTVFLATGFGFPDALAGAALAGGAPAPLLLAQRDCVPREVLAELRRLNPSLVVVLGGSGVLSREVASLETC